MSRATKVEARPGYRLSIEFSDGVAGVIDFADRLFGTVFVPLRDESLFEQVTLDPFGAPCWPNGADLAPDAIYERLRKQGEGATAASLPSPN
jgi:hypothetical protein